MNVAVKTAGNYKTLRWLSRLVKVKRDRTRSLRQQDAGVERGTDESSIVSAVNSPYYLQLACFLAPRCELFQPYFLQSVFERPAVRSWRPDRR